MEIARDVLRARRTGLLAAESQVATARAEQTEIEAGLQAVITARGEAERALSERAARHDALSRRVYEARSASERLGLRAEQVAADGERLARRIERAEVELTELTRTDDGARRGRGRRHDRRPPGHAGRRAGRDRGAPL